MSNEEIKRYDVQSTGAAYDTGPYVEEVEDIDGKYVKHDDYANLAKLADDYELLCQRKDAAIAELTKQLAAARGAALEQAAKVAFNAPLIQTHGEYGYMTDECKAMAVSAASAIRALASQPAAPVQQPGDVREAWEYSFIHSSALDKGDTEVGPCLTYDRSVAYGVGCFNQRQLFIGQALATTMPSTSNEDSKK